MATTWTALIDEVRESIVVIRLEQLKARLDTGSEMTLLDVRETEEFRRGHLPGAIHLPRGFLEMQIEKRLPDKSAPIVVYCAGGARSALAAKTQSSLGYTHVESADPGFARWKELGYPTAVPPSAGDGLSDAQRERYARHLMLPEVGEQGQLKLLKSKVLLLGVGGLGSPAALYLAAAGIGTIGVVDADVVDASNLQRQIVHTTARLGQPKVDSAARVLGDLNPDVTVVTFRERLDRGNVDRIFDGFDLVIDGCDNFPTRYLVNDACVFKKLPVVHGSIFRFEGQVTTFVPGHGPCYRCLYREPPPPHLAPSCAEAGVLGVLPGIIGTLQATEAIKLLLGRGEPLIGRLVCYDALRATFRELKLRRDPACPVCGDNPTVTDYIDYEGFCSLG